MPSPVSRDQWIETMEPTLLELFTAGLEDDTDWKKCWTIKESDKRREEVLEYAKPDVVQETPEGAPYVTLRIEKVRTAAVVHTDFTGQIRITHQMMRDKQYDDMADQTWGLGEAVNRKMYEDAVQRFYDGFSSVTSPDSLSVFNTAHTLTGSSSTYSNRSSEALSDDAINNLRVKLMKTLNENGKVTPYGTKSLQLIVPAPLRQLGERLTMKGQYVPGGADFDVLVNDLELVCLPLLAETTNATIRDAMWFLRDKKKAKNYHFEREAPKFAMYRDQDNDDVVVKVRCAYSFLWASPRGVAGSTGA